MELKCRSHNSIVGSWNYEWVVIHTIMVQLCLISGNVNIAKTMINQILQFSSYVRANSKHFGDDR